MSATPSAPDTIPAATPPPGQTYNFVNPPYEGARFAAVNVVFLVLALAAIVIRIWARTVVLGKFGADDCFMILAMFLSAALSGCTLMMLNYGLGRHLWDVPLNWLSPYFLRYNLIADILYCAATGAVKVSILLLYLRIFPSRKFFWVVSGVIFIAAGRNMAGVFVNIFSCSPIAASWDVTITEQTCINRPVFYIANAGLGIFTDFLTILVPIPLLRSLQLPPRQKIGVAVILLTGSFVCVVSIIRLSSLFTLLKSDDLTFDTTNALLWCIIELNMSIVGGSVPAMKPFFNRYFPALLGLASSHANQGGDCKDYYKHGKSRSIRDGESRKLSNFESGIGGIGYGANGERSVYDPSSGFTTTTVGAIGSRNVRSSRTSLRGRSIGGVDGGSLELIFPGSSETLPANGGIVRTVAYGVDWNDLGATSPQGKKH